MVAQDVVEDWAAILKLFGDVLMVLGSAGFIIVCGAALWGWWKERSR
jgi:hypothetical protein